MVLVIGYGNSLRSDDGAGRKVAEILAQQQRTDLRCLSIHQLTPELATEIAQARAVIFADAIASEATAITVHSFQPTPSEAIDFGHTSNPQSLLALTQYLYQKRPPAWWVLIPGRNFEFGEQLSASAERFVADACREIEQLIELL